MTLLLLEGCESRATTDPRSTTNTAIAGGDPTVGGGVTGNCFQCMGFGGGGGAYQFSLGADAHGTVSAGADIALFPTSATSGNSFVNFGEGGNYHVFVGVDTTGHLRVGTSSASGYIATSTFTHTWTSFHNVEVQIVVHDTAGVIRVLVDGIEEINLTGIDTKNGGTGLIDNVWWYGVNTTNDYGFNIDNIWVTNGDGPAPFNGGIGPQFIEYLFPSGNGDSSDWVNDNGDSTDNYTHVDDVSSTDYVEGSTSGDTDLYDLPDGTTALGSVVATQVMVLAAKVSAGTPPGDLQAVQKSSGGTVTEDTLVAAVSITTSYVWYLGPFKTEDPNGDPWTDSRLAGLQTGVKVS